MHGPNFSGSALPAQANEFFLSVRPSQRVEIQAAARHAGAAEEPRKDSTPPRYATAYLRSLR